MFLTAQQQENLVEQGLATKKINPELNLVTYKYARRVMYDYLWNRYPELMECRGHTYDLSTGQLVVAAPRKSFKYLENDNWKDKSLDTKVKIYKKFNGFMACLTVHKGRVIVSTTGSTSGAYVEMAKEKIFASWPEEMVKQWPEGGSWLFEICHKNDPHIVHEEPKAYYLGYRSSSTGIFDPIWNPSDEPNIHYTLGQALSLAEIARHEGYMCYDVDTGEVCKLKSPYYDGKKFLMRMKSKKIDLYGNTRSVENNLPDIWKHAPELIVSKFSKQQWSDLPEQDRRKYLESIDK